MTTATPLGPVVIVLEDDAGFRGTLLAEFGERGYRVFGCASLTELDSALANCEEPPRFAVVDLRLNGDSGLTAIDAILGSSPEARVVVLTGHGTLPTAVEAMKLGAVNYLTKPTRFRRLERALWSDEADPEEVAVPYGRETLARREREYIEYVLVQCEGNITRAARWLGIHRQSLQRKLRKFPPRT